MPDDTMRLLATHPAGGLSKQAVWELSHVVTDLEERLRSEMDPGSPPIMYPVLCQARVRRRLLGLSPRGHRDVRSA
jgi:hypothetical protein